MERDEGMEKIRKRLEFIYGTEEKASEAEKKLKDILKKYSITNEPAKELTQEDTMLITYGDSIVREGTDALEVLGEFLHLYVKDAINNVHLLPMYPYTSDDGFSVVDYRKIQTELGGWGNIEVLSKNYGLMFDAVINHISKSSEWFQKYLAGEKPYTDYFITCDPKADYNKVTRPRALPLLTEFETVQGKRFVWTTFSEDQIDLNFACPELLAEIMDILIMYGRAGARFIRLDAIGFMWKELGTSCMHLPQAHELIKLMKDVLNIYSPSTKIITETNVPHKDNISYFGNGHDEADLVYQFPLPPLVMYSLLKKDASVLSQWMKTLELPGDEVTFFNFLSSHDGIGVRPTEGILTDEDRDFLVEKTLRHGGRVSYKDNGDGTKSPYELNINYQDALAGPEESDDTRIRRFLAAETILLSIQGIPGIYIHSLLGSRNDYYGMTTSDIPRRINREHLEYEDLKGQLEGETNRNRIFKEMLHLLHIRKGEKAFAPQAEQEVLDMDSRVLALRRKHTASGECIYVYINGSDENVNIGHLAGTNLLNEKRIEKEFTLAPYEAAWVKMN